MRLLANLRLTTMTVGLSLCLCAFAGGRQNEADGHDSLQEQANEQARQFGERAFQSCEGNASYYTAIRVPGGEETSSGNAFNDNLRSIFEDAMPEMRAQRGCGDVWATDCEMVVEMRRNAQGDAFDKANSFQARLDHMPSPAEQLNGEWRGFITLNYSVSRTRLLADGTWRGQDWGKFQDNRSPVLVAALARENGQWLVSDLRIVGRVRSNESTPTAEYPLGKSLHALLGEVSSTMVPMSKLNIEAVPCSKIGSQPVTLLQNLSSNRVFTGSAEEFATAYPQFLDRAARTLHIDPHAYDSETAIIIDTARTCATITPQMARSVTGFGGLVILRNLGPRYLKCINGVDSARAEPSFDSLHQRSIVMMIDNRVHPQDFSQPFVFDVFFASMPSDNSNATSATLFKTYGIVHASVK